MQKLEILVVMLGLLWDMPCEVKEKLGTCSFSTAKFLFADNFYEAVW
jgi:hypothetical protein